MHQIVCRLGLRPRPNWWNLQRFQDPLAGFQEPTYKRGKERGEVGRAWKGRGKDGRRQEGREEGVE